MKISTKGRYGLRVMLDLAVYGENNYVSLTEVAKRQKVSLKYLESIISSLKNGGLVLSTRGKSGGYKLAKAPAEYTVGEILKAAEGNLAPVSCLGEGADCPHADQCLSLPVWEGLDKIIDEYLENITLEQVLTKKVGIDG